MASKTNDTVLIDDGVIKVKQGTQLVRIIKVCEAQNIGRATFDGKVRVKAYRDHYDFQSHYTAEVWSGNAWKSVVSLDGMDPWAKSETLEHVCERLLADAKLVLL